METTVTLKTRWTETCWWTYFGALMRWGGVAFRGRRSEECVPVIRQTHFLFLAGWNEMKKPREKVYESQEGDWMKGDMRWGQSWVSRSDLAALAFAVRHVVKERLQTGLGCNCLAGLRHTIGVQVEFRLLPLKEEHPKVIRQTVDVSKCRPQGNRVSGDITWSGYILLWNRQYSTLTYTHKQPCICIFFF